MIDVKQAAKAAAEYFVDLYPDQEYTHILLEEAEHDENENVWSITLGYSIPNPASVLGVKLPDYRRYKVFKIDAETGKVISMKIRTVENV